MSTNGIAPAIDPTATATDALSADDSPAPIVRAETRAVTETSLTIAVGRSVPAQVQALMKQVRQAQALCLGEKAQEELARILKLIPDLVAKSDPYLVEVAALAVTGLMEGEPSLVFARSVRREIEGELGRWKTPFRAMYRGRPPLRATLGLLLFLFGGSVALMLLTMVGSSGTFVQVQGVDGGLLAVAAAMGGIGSIISIFVRVPQMTEDFQGSDPEVPFFVGLLKPIVGMAFAVFGFVAIEGGFLPITVDPTRKGAFVMAISFVAGFSERFVPDLINKTEASGLDIEAGAVLQQRRSVISSTEMTPAPPG